MKTLTLAVCCALAFISSSAQAMSIFTDRLSFDAAVGQTQLITFDQPLTDISYPNGDPHYGIATIDGALTYTGDVENFIFQTPGHLCLCGNFPGLLSTVNPVLAFGADFNPLSFPIAVGGPPLTNLMLAGHQFTIGQPSFLGILYNPGEATTVDVSRILQPSPYELLYGGLTWSSFSLSNVEVKAVPEPSGLHLAILATLLLFTWHRLQLRIS